MNIVLYAYAHRIMCVVRVLMEVLFEMDSNILYLNIQNVLLGLGWVPNDQTNFNMFLDNGKELLRNLTNIDFINTIIFYWHGECPMA
jgi:hypothetical protein